MPISLAEKQQAMRQRMSKRPRPTPTKPSTAISVLRAIAEWYQETNWGEGPNGGALLFDDDRPLAMHIREALANHQVRNVLTGPYSIIKFIEPGESSASLHWANKRKQEGEPFLLEHCSTPQGIKELADFLDQNAEDCNAHEFVGCHRLLAFLIHNYGGLVGAAKLLYAIATFGGLNAMLGVFGKESAYKRLGLSEPWKDWEL